MKKSEILNLLSSKIWQGKANYQDSLRFQKMATEKSKMCKDFEQMTGDELLSLQQACSQ